MDAVKSTSYMIAQSTALGALGFAAGWLAHTLVKTTITRVAIGAMGATVLGGAVAVQYISRVICVIKEPAQDVALYLQSAIVELYYVAACTTFVALGTLSIPQALIALSLLSIYPISLALLTYKNDDSGHSFWDSLAEIPYVPEKPLDFVIGREFLQLIEGLRSKN
jgi:hypothetical protein